MELLFFLFIFFFLIQLRGDLQLQSVWENSCNMHSGKCTFTTVLWGPKPASPLPIRPVVKAELMSDGVVDVTAALHCSLLCWMFTSVFDYFIK